MMNYYSLIILYFLASTSTVHSQSRKELLEENRRLKNEIFRPELGKCYAKCFLHHRSKNKNKEIELPVYSGTAPNPKYVKDTIIVIKQNKIEWVSKTIDPCFEERSCIGGCLVETPALYDTIRIVIDTILNNDFELQTFAIIPLLDEYQQTEWREVVCGEEYTSYLVKKVQRALKERGYYKGEIDNTLGDSTKTAIIKFQRENKLPIGQMDYDTLKLLGIVD